MEAQTELCLKICFIVCFNVTWQYVNHMKRIVIINLFRSSSSFTLHNCSYSHYVVAEVYLSKEQTQDENEAPAIPSRADICFNLERWNSFKNLDFADSETWSGKNETPCQHICCFAVLLCFELYAFRSLSDPFRLFINFSSESRSRPETWSHKPSRSWLTTAGVLLWRPGMLQ